MMLLALLWLSGCTDAVPEQPPAPSETFPFGLNPDECVPGVVTVGETFGDYVMTLEEVEPYRCVNLLTIRAEQDVELPNLEVVQAQLVVFAVADQEPVALNLPVLTSANGLLFAGPVTRVEVPQLRSILQLDVDTSHLGDLSHFANVESIGRLALFDGTDFSGLQISSTDLSVRSEAVLGLDNLTEVGLEIGPTDMDDVSGLDNVVRLRRLVISDSAVRSLDALDGVQTSGDVRLTLVSELSSLSGLSALATVDGDLLIQGAEGFESIGMTALTEVTGDLHLVDTTATAIDLPQLTQVGGTVVFRDNPELPSCDVERLVTRLQAAGFTGAVENSGNDTEAVCTDP